jgi:excisionase family DNA binding protein
MNQSGLLTTAEAARYLAVAEHTLEIWRSTKRHRIPYIKIGKNVRYRRQDLDAWLVSRMIDADVAAA